MDVQDECFWLWISGGETVNATEHHVEVTVPMGNYVKMIYVLIM